MEADFSDFVPCSSIAVDSVLRLSTAGVIWGSCYSPFDAKKLDCRFHLKPKSVRMRGGSILVLAVYLAAPKHCTLSSLLANADSHLDYLLQYFLFLAAEYKGIGSRKTGLILCQLVLLLGPPSVPEIGTGNKLLVLLGFSVHVFNMSMTQNLFDA